MTTDTSECPRCDGEGEHVETNRGGRLYECDGCGGDFIV